ncbi:MAG: DMT family transporter [Alphaproteobacteria bacterium]
MPDRPLSRDLFGIALVAAAAAAYGLNIVLARLVYDEGANPGTFLALRGVGFSAALLAFLLATGRPRALRPRDRYISLGLGALIAGQTYAFYSAVQFIPVSLAVLILSLYPLLVALGMRLFEREPLGPVKLAALVGAFAGLALVLRVAPVGFDLLGVGLAFGATLVHASVILAGNRILARADSMRLALHMIGTATVLYAAALATADEIALPATAEGWALLALAPVAYLFAVVGFYASLPLIGPTKASMVGNTEPVFTVALAALLLAERLAPLQLLGAAVVIGSVFVLHASGGRRPVLGRAPE